MSNKPWPHRISAEAALMFSWCSYLVLIIAIGCKPNSPFCWSVICVSALCALTLIYKGKAEKIAPAISTEIIFWSVLLCQTIGWIAWTEANFLSFRMNNFDTGIFANLSYHFFTSGQYYSSILGMHGFADHFTPNLAVLSVLYYFFNTPLLFSFLKIPAYAACALILKKASKGILGKGSPYINIIPLLFLLNKYVFAWMTMQFQPSSLALPFFLAALYFASQKKYFEMFVMLFITSGFKEHLGLCWIVAGSIGTFYNKDRGVGIATAFGGIFLSSIIYFFIMPAFAEWHRIHHMDRLGMFALWKNKASMVSQVLCSVGFLPLLTPFSLFAIIPCFAISFLSGDLNMTTLNFHYHDIGICAALFFSIYGLKQLIQYNLAFEGGCRVKSLFIFAITAVLILNYSGRQPMRYAREDWPTQSDRDTFAEVHKIRAFINDCQIPSVVAQDFLGPYFFDLPFLGTIAQDSIDQNLPEGSLVIVSTVVDPWPLSQRQLEKLTRDLDSSSRYIPIKGFKNVHVWRKLH